MASKPKQPITKQPTPERAGIIEAVGKGGAYALLAALALALEGVLLAAFAKSQSGFERIAEGMLGAGVFIVTIVAVVLIERMRQPIPAAVRELDKPGVSPNEIAKVQQLAAKDGHTMTDLIPAPDGSFVIGRAPPGWTMRWTTMAGMIKEMLGVTAEVPNPGSDIFSSILVVEHGPPMMLVPLPGHTRFLGRKMPILLGEPISRRFMVLSTRRRLPPTYVERSLYDTVVMFMSSVLQSGIVSVRTITAGRVPGTDREMIVLEATQEVEDFRLADQDIDYMRVALRFSAIRGDLYDYIVNERNLHFDRVTVDRDADQAEAIFQKLRSSFTMLQATDPKWAAEQDAARADRDFEAYLAETGPIFFNTQFEIALSKIAALDLANAKGIAQAVAILKPFELFDQIVPNSDIDCSGLWNALRAAEGGNAQLLRDTLRKKLPIPEPPQPALPSPTS